MHAKRSTGYSESGHDFFLAVFVTGLICGRFLSPLRLEMATMDKCDGIWPIFKAYRAMNECSRPQLRIVLLTWSDDPSRG
jgi:hypothetical protein